MLRRFEHNQVYHPNRDFEVTAAALGRPFEDVYFQARDGTSLNGWFFPANPGSARGQWAALVCHGNAGNISHRLDLYRALLVTGVNVFAFDYRGFGRSAGTPGEEGTYLDGQAAHRWLRSKGYPGSKIIAYGESLGGGIASELCLREETGGLILQSTFTSIPDIGKELYPWLPVRWISSIQYDTRGKLPRLKIPVLVMHGRDDEVIGFHHAERNFAAANEPKFFCELSGPHNNAGWESPEFGEAVLKLLRAAQQQPAQP